MWKPGPNPAMVPTDANLNSISLEYSYDDVARASRNFSPNHLLGKGSYGSVYRGILKDGTEVAIKVLSTPKDSGFKEEVLVLSKFRHPNLVILMGFSRNGKERYLIYELLPGGDLCSRIQSDVSFDWRHRLTASLDAALGLSHLHNASPKVFHRDIKTQNILLDRNGTAKMADFGLALLAQPRQGVRVEQCSGTLGYADPLYIHSSVVTEKSEVYSFGMVLFEILTGKPPAIQGPNGQIIYVYQNIHSSGPSTVMGMLQARAGWPVELAQRLVKLALACTDGEESRRPIFVHIVARLRDLINRFVKMDVTAKAAAPSVASYERTAPPGIERLLQNQVLLEDALKRVGRDVITDNAAPKQAAKGWNPFADDQDILPVVAENEKMNSAKNSEDTEKATLKSDATPATRAAPDDGNLPCVDKPTVTSTTPPSTKPVPSGTQLTAAADDAQLLNKLVNRAVAEFDEELRAMSKDASSEVNAAMSVLFPGDLDTSAADDSTTTRVAKQKREIAKHLICAGFALDQIKPAIAKTNSVEAAVEWIIEQKWK